MPASVLGPVHYSPQLAQLPLTAAHSVEAGHLVLEAEVDQRHLHWLVWHRAEGVEGAMMGAGRQDQRTLQTSSIAQGHRLACEALLSSDWHLAAMSELLCDNQKHACFQSHLSCVEEALQMRRIHPE